MRDVLVFSSLEQESIGMLMAQVDPEGDEDDTDDGSKNAHHYDLGLQRAWNCLVVIADHLSEWGLGLHLGLTFKLFYLSLNYCKIIFYI